MRKILGKLLNKYIFLSRGNRTIIYLRIILCCHSRIKFQNVNVSIKNIKDILYYQINFTSIYDFKTVQEVKKYPQT